MHVSHLGYAEKQMWHVLPSLARSLIELCQRAWCFSEQSPNGVMQLQLQVNCSSSV